MAIELYAKHLRIGVMFIKTALCKHLLAPITAMTPQIRYLVIQLKNLCFEASPQRLACTALFLVLLQERVKKKLSGKENHIIFFTLYRE